MDFQEFNKAYEKILLTADSQKAMQLLTLLNKGGFNVSADKVVILKWIALDRLSDREILELFQNYFKEGLELEFYDLKDQVRNKFLTSVPESKRDDYKKEILKAISNNQQKISSQNYLTGNNQSVANSIGVWLKDYLVFGGAEPLTNIKELEFYKSNKNWGLLNNQQREQLRLMFNLVEWLKHSNFSLRGDSEPAFLNYDGEYYGIIDGRVYKAKDLIDDLSLSYFAQISGNQSNALPKTSFSINPQILRSRYQEILKQLLPANGVAKKPASHEPEVLLNQLNNDLALRDAGAVVADLENLIQLKGLLKLLKSKNFSSDFIIYLEAHLGMGLEDQATRLSPESLSLFLQFLLINKLQLSLEQSAVIGLYLANVLAKQNQREFLPIAYCDLSSNTFKWREVIGENGKLKFK
ncbi:MAG: hypothetical protein WCV73_03915 [Patescibacteria group bacterium]|jgi:hypothetical protein